jgi:hypothetical protein
VLEVPESIIFLAPHKVTSIKELGELALLWWADAALCGMWTREAELFCWISAGRSSLGMATPNAGSSTCSTSSSILVVRRHGVSMS